MYNEWAKPLKWFLSILFVYKRKERKYKIVYLY